MLNKVIFPLKLKHSLAQLYLTNQCDLADSPLALIISHRMKLPQVALLQQFFFKLELMLIITTPAYLNQFEPLNYQNVQDIFFSFLSYFLKYSALTYTLYICSIQQRISTSLLFLLCSVYWHVATNIKEHYRHLLCWCTIPGVTHFSSSAFTLLFSQEMYHLVSKSFKILV